MRCQIRRNWEYRHAPTFIIDIGGTLYPSTCLFEADLREALAWRLGEANYYTKSHILSVAFGSSPSKASVASSLGLSAYDRVMLYQSVPCGLSIAERQFNPYVVRDMFPGSRLVACSNFLSIQTRRILERLGYVSAFDWVLGPDVVGRMKEYSLFMNYALKIVSADPSKVVAVGDCFKKDGAQVVALGGSFVHFSKLVTNLAVRQL